MDEIFITQLRARGIIGVNEWERSTPQDILISLRLFVETAAAGQSDDIADCVSYSDIARRVRQHAEAVQRFTVEALAEDLARLCLQDSRVVRVRVRVEKPEAVRMALSAGVEIERGRSDLPLS